MVNFGPLTAEICWRVWAPNKFQRVSRLGSVTARHWGVSQTLRRWTEGATYIRQGGHHVGHWPTFYSQVCHGVGCSVKNGSCSSSKPSESRWTV